MSRTFKVLDEKELDQVNGGMILRDSFITKENNLLFDKSGSDTPGVNNAFYNTSDTPLATLQGTKNAIPISGGSHGTDMA